MTGQSSSGPVRLLLRAPPHLPFVQGYPGIPAGGNRPAATVQGTVEVRTAGVKAKWVRVEIRKHESIPSAIIGKSSGINSTVHVGSPHVLWKPGEGKEFDALSTADFRFVMPFPGDSPPSVELRGCKVTYELIAAVCYKGKGGLFKKDSSTIATVSEPLRITKYELASAWPMYNQLEQRTASALNGAVTLVVDRPIQAFGPGDRIVVTATIRSEAQNQFRLKGFEMALVEIMTIFPTKPDPNSKKKNKPPSPPTIKRNTVCNTRAVADGLVAPGGERGARLDLVVPSDRQLLTVRGAKEFQVEYELVVEAACDGGPSKVLLGGMQCHIGTFPRSSAQQAVKDIGFVQNLCPRAPPGGHQPPPSIHGSTTSGKPGMHDVGQFGPQNMTTPPRGHHASLSHSGSFLTTEAAPYYRPLSMNPPHVHRTPSPPLPMLPMSNTFQQQQQPPRQPQAQGFVPRDKWRRSSSGTTTTTTTTATGLTDHGPIADRNASTMPVGGYRASVNFPSPNPARPGESTFGPTFEELESPADTQRTVRAAQSDIGHGGNRLSSHPAGAYGGWNNSHQDRFTNSSSPTTTTTDDTSATQHTPNRPESANTTPTRASGGWASAANEKQRLFEEARNRAANIQAANGAVLSNIGMDNVPAGAPPEYTPPPPAKPSTPVNQRQSPIHESPQSVRSLRGAGPAAAIGAVAAGLGAASVAGARSSNGSPAPAPPQVVATPPAEEPIPYEQIFPAGPASSSSGPSKPVVPLSPRHSPAPPQEYMSAAQEKDAMRRRYEEAQGRVALAVRGSSAGESGSQNGHAQGSSSGPSYSPSARVRTVSSGPSQSPSTPQGQSSSVPQAYMSAAEEKEMMRKRYEEAQGRVRAATESPRAVSDAGPAPRSVSGAGSVPGSPYASSHTSPQAPQMSQVPAPYMSAVEEKEMMRKRYEEAANAVNRATAGSPSAAGPSTQAASSSSPSYAAAPASPSTPSYAPPAVSSPAYMSAAEEKDMMRKRYMEATNAVNRATGSGSSDSPGAGPGPSSQVSPPQISPAYMSAAEEKEMMRRRYEEAQGRVARATSSSPPPPASSAPAFAPAASSSSARDPPLQAAYMSAEQEKEMMRRRYEEAQGRVARATGVADSPGAGSSSMAAASAAPAPITDEPIPYDELFGPGSGASAGPSSSAAAQAPSSSAHMSAAEEKDMMRRRYEQAQNAVNQAAYGGSPQASGSSSKQSPTARASLAAPSYGTPSQPSSSSGGYMSAEQEKDLMRQRYEAAQDAVNRAGAGPSSSGSPSASSHAPHQYTQPHLARAGSAVYPAGGSGSGSGAPSNVSHPGTSQSSPPQRAMTRKERMMSALPDGPPPPLAPRPPREYVDLLERRG